MATKPFTGNDGTFDGGGASGDWADIPDKNAKTKTQEAAMAVAATYGNKAQTIPFVQVTAKKLTAEQKAVYDAQNYQNADNNIPTVHVTAKRLAKETGTTVESDHKVTLTEVGTDTIVIFEVLPEISENHAAEYEAVAPSQFPGAFQKYKGTTTTTWVLNAMFISRTTAEATQNYNYVNTLRGWTQPFFGKKTGASFPHKLGAPPPVLTLKGLRGLIGPVPVVMTSLTWNWPKDVDYIATSIEGTDGKPIPWPTVISLPINLVESYSIDQFDNFSLADYRAGRMPIAFSVSDASIVQAGLGTPVNENGDPQ